LDNTENDLAFDLVLLDLEMPDLDGFETAEIIKNTPVISSTKIVLMPSYGLRGHARDAAQMGISAYLIKPIRQVELFDCISTLMGAVLNKEMGTANLVERESLITRHSMLEKRAEHYPPVLIVAKSQKTQSVISMQLELLGHRSEPVSDGIEALEAIKRRTYSMVMIDVDTPGMDGFTVAENMRSICNKSGVPMIGITADPTEREHRLSVSAGMQSYISLPFSEELLEETIVKFVSDGSFDFELDVKLENELPKRESDHDNNVESFVLSLISEIGPEMTGMTISLFAEDATRHISEIAGAIRDKDSESLSDLAASFALSCEGINANYLKSLCVLLEAKGRNQNIEGAESLFKEIKSNYNLILETLEKIQFEGV
jgi:CheY-like chemotaxis protein